MSVVGQVKNVMRFRAGRFDLPGVAMATLLVTTILSGCLTGLEPATQDVPVEPDLSRDLSAGLLSGVIAGSGASRLLRPDANGVPQMPGDLGELMGRVLPPGVERLPLPTPPADEPMVAALGAYATSQGVPTPSADVLRPAVDALLLDDEAEQALAMLILAYVQTFDLQRQATERLLPHEVELLEQVDPSDAAALDAALEKIDRDLMLQGADLLARAAEAAKDPLGNPPLSLEEVQARRAATSGPAAAPTASAPASAPASSQAGWDVLEAILAELGGGPLPKEEAGAPPTLAEAMASLAAVYGAPVPPLPSLPLSLDHAVASIVHAQAMAATSDDPARSAQRLVATARAAEPTLRAWGAWLAMVDEAADPTDPDLTAFLTQVLSPSPSPAALVAAGRGRAAPEPIEAPPLSELLISSGMDAATVAAVEASLGPEVSHGLAQLIAAALHVQGAYDTAMAGLPVQQQVALQNEAAITALLDKPFWTDAEAAAVEALALAHASLLANGGFEAMQSAQEEALATVEEAVKGLTEALPSLQVPASHDADPLPHTPGTPSTDSLPGSRPGCVELPMGLSRCSNDVLLRREVMGYLVIVTGFGGTDLDPAELGDPDIHIDLGGSDVYRAAMGAARTDRSPGDNVGDILPKSANNLNLEAASEYLSGQIAQTTASFSVDLAGDDTYLGSGSLAQGTGSGISALGILWDVSSNDRYLHHTEGQVAYGQGAGARGGVGILMDTGGDDRYEATGAGGRTQGVGIQGDTFTGEDGDLLNPVVRRAGAAGLLLDLGAGSDKFTSAGGQGHSAGHGNTGLLLDQEGKTTYTVTSISTAWQGGRAAAQGLVADNAGGSAGGLAALVDLGGAGDRYLGAGDLDAGIAYWPEGENPRRTDDSAWIDSRANQGAAFSLGLDSSLRDEDGDGWPSLAELLAGSDPHDASESPPSIDPEDLVRLVEEMIAGGPEGLIRDSDEDGYSDVTEKAANSDPMDADSTPLDIVPLQSFSDNSLCPADEPCIISEQDPQTATCNAEKRTKPCISLLSLGMAGPDVHDHPAIVRIDFGGGDAYTHDVASGISAQYKPGPFNSATVTTGSIHIDIAGDDTYLTPTRKGTQGSAPAERVSILLDLDGNDQYSAGASSQGHGVGGGNSDVTELAGEGAGEGLGILADLAGDDTYTFFTQGRGDGGTGVFFDGGGKDAYHSVDATGHAVSPEELAAADAAVFSSQGGSAKDGRGRFVDVGDEWDEYWVPLTDGTDGDASPVKNDVVLHRNRDSWFADGQGAAIRDDDGDGGIGLVESLLSTHPGREDDDRSIYNDPASDPLGALESVEDGRPVLDSTWAVDSSWLLGVPGLVVGGRGDSIYTKNALFLVDLGGHDQYLAPDTASSIIGVSLLLDVLPAGGSGNDQYLPSCTTTTRDQLSCLSLGATKAGVSILADAGGENKFHTHVALDRTYGIDTPRVDVVVHGLSQGAGVEMGVGILATWNASNEFYTEVAAKVIQANAQAFINVSVEGRSQGFGFENGIGLVANFGANDDSYKINAALDATNVRGHLSKAAAGQGATLSTPADSPESVVNERPPGHAVYPDPNRHIQYAFCLLKYLGLGGDYACPNWPEPRQFGFSGPVGLLLDQGGNNNMRAVDGYAQASGSGGVLWNGDGDDTYVAGPYSQASDGILVELGGNDQFLLLPPATRDIIVAPAGCTQDCRLYAEAHAQGSGKGLLLDMQGDDIHDATGWDLTQGATGGMLLDLGGSDAYLAHDRSQGYEGLLLDLTGWDLYRLGRGDESRGQGYGSDGLFMDAGGEDRYEGKTVAGPIAPEPAPAVLSGGRRDDNNGWKEAGGQGVDVEDLEVTYTVLRRIAGSVALSVHEDNDLATDNVIPDPSSGVQRTVHLFATVTEQMVAVDRVTFLVDNSVIGHGTAVPDAPGIYYLGWETTNLAEPVPDGRYMLVAAAFPTLQGEAVVDLPASYSPPVEVGVDNPPRLTTQLRTKAFSPAVDGATALMDVQLSRDLSFPSGVQGSTPGGWLNVDGRNLATATEGILLPRMYLEGGDRVVRLCPTSCDDGRYNLTVTATDKAGQTSSTFEFLMVDSRAPTTTISTVAGPGYANARDKAGGHLQIQLKRDDDSRGLGADNVSGINKTLLVKLPAKVGDPPLYTRLIQNADLTIATVPYTEGESPIRLVAVSVDVAGNEESPCEEGEKRYMSQRSVGAAGLCYRASKVTELVVDTDRPSMFNLQVDRTHVRPGEPIKFQVEASDQGTGIKSVAVQIQDESPTAMVDVGDGLFVFDQWGTYNKELVGKDGRPIYAGREVEYFFSVTAIDNAGNDRSIVTSGNVIDDLAPRVEPRPTRYTDPADDSSIPQGRPGTTAMLVAKVTDLSPSSIASMHVVGLGDILGEERPPTPCKPDVDSDFTLWGCTFLLEDDFPEGTFEVAVRVEDLAGNVNETATLPLVVDAEAVTITDLHVASVSHDGFTLAWKTSSPATSQVRYGQTPSVDRATQKSGDYVTDHSVEVRGLVPSTDYFFKALSVSRSGVMSQSAASGTDVVKTRNAFTVDLPALTEGETLQGQVGLAVAIGLLSGSEPVDVKIGIQDADGRTTPRPLKQLRSPPIDTVSIETRTIPDGAYRFVVEASRGVDRMTLKSSTFFIDNTPPALSPMEPLAGAVTGDAEVSLRVAAVDTAGDLSDVTVLVNGNAVSSAYAVEEAIGLQGGIISITLSQPFTDGLHTVEVVATDPVGNAGSTSWNFRVDTTAPETTDARVARYEPGPTAARVGATVHVAVNATDVSGVANVVVDTSALGASAVPLSPDGLDRWVGSFVVPDQASAGAHSLPLVATDHIGNSAPVGTIAVVVDRTAPSVLGTDTTSPNATGIVVRVRVDEPSAVQITAGGQTFTSPNFTSVHLMNVTNLRPNTVYALNIRATDGAGLATTITASQRTEPDTGPPTSPSHLLADASEEGVVVLSWKAAQDDSGIDSYLVTRTMGGTTETLPAVPGNELVLRDVLPRPVPNEATYHVRAVDLADQAGAATSVQAQILSLPHLHNATLSPERGTTDDPFVVKVSYWSPNGRPADSLELVLGDHRFPLHQVEPGRTCLTACLYSARLSLPATSIDAAARPMFLATSGQQTAELELGWTPVVRSGADGIVVRGELETPGPSAPALLFLLLAALAILRSWRRRP